MRALAIDFETANEERGSACAIGLAWIEEGIVARRAYRLIRPPGLRFSYWNSRVHGLTARDVADAPPFAEVFAEFAADLAAYPLIAHNAAFDSGVIVAACARDGLALPGMKWMCTVQIARRAWPGQPSYSLGRLAGSVGIPIRHHHAGDDAFACAEIARLAAQECRAPDLAALARIHGLAASHVLPGPPLPRRRSGPVADAPRGPVFRVRGRTGAEYEITLGSENGRPVPRCTCIAGQMRRLCRHVRALTDGDVTDLLSDNADEVVGFAANLGQLQG